MTHLHPVLRIGLGLVLVVAGVFKAGNAEALAESIANYRLVPAPVAQCGAVILPWLEIVSGLLLVVGLWVGSAAGWSAALFAVFSLAVLSALARGLDLSCGCFGGDGAARVGVQTLLLDVVGLVSALVVFRSRPQERPTL